jgi:hypothetical protein
MVMAAGSIACTSQVRYRDEQQRLQHRNRLAWAYFVASMKGVVMKDGKQCQSSLTSRCASGTPAQRRAIERWGKTGWTLLHWTDVPRMVAVMENNIGDVAFIDRDGNAWTGPRFSKADPLPMEQYQSKIVDESIVTCE